MGARPIEINFHKIKKTHFIPQTKDDLSNHLRKQYKFLCKSLLDIQKGDSDEIDRVALALRILFHTTKRCKGLLSQINAKIEILDTCPKVSLPQDYDEAISQQRLLSSFNAGMVTYTLGSIEKWKLTPSTNSSWVGLEEWWNRLLFEDNGIKFTPKELVCCIANTDGGAHIDPNLKSHYCYLERTGSVGGMYFIDGKQHFPAGPVKVILPHIGHEVVSSLKRSFPEICPEYGLPDPNQKF
ncbi:MAG: hypothetical protein K1000chlam2_01132 [Chlamydiae bacterium]|nr:hypothetical protein [Chlamydiota bacterium]